MQLVSQIYEFLQENDYHLEKILEYVNKEDVDFCMVTKKEGGRRDINLFVCSDLETRGECARLSWGEKE